jgi:hypothetical protein
MQQVNLYLDEFKHIEPPYSATMLMFLAMYSLVFGLLVGGVLLLTLWWQQSDLKTNQQQLGIWQDNLSIAKIEFPEPKVDEHFKQNIARLKNELAKNKVVLKYLQSRQIEVEHQSFSVLLLALTWVSEKDLWLTDIKITEGGENLALSGRSLQAHSLPNYLKKLSELDVFSQMQFRVFEMDRDGNEFTFVVSSKREEGSLEKILEQISNKN